MIHQHYILESFDIELEHIKDGKIWNLILQKWVITPSDLIEKLLAKISAWDELKTFREHLFNPFDPNSLKINGRLQKNYDKTKIELYGHANQFCIIHKGYSLN